MYPPSKIVSKQKKKNWCVPN